MELPRTTGIDLPPPGESELLGRLLQLPTAQPAATPNEHDLWRVPELEAQL